MQNAVVVKVARLGGLKITGVDVMNLAPIKTDLKFFARERKRTGEGRGKG